jgi:YD repeat-containing protein
MLFTYFMIGLLFISCEDKEDVKSNCAEIQSFSFKEIELELDFDENNEAQAVLSEDADLSSLTAVFKACEGAKVFVDNVIQTSGYTKNDFSSPVTYRVVAENDSQSEYTISLYREIQIYDFRIEELKNIQFDISSDLNSISATVPYGTDLTNLTAIFNVSDYASLFVGDTEQISGETINDFDQSLTYTLKGPGVEDIEYQVVINVAENAPPVADAGNDQVVLIPEGETSAMVWLDGTASSDAEGQISAYEWTADGQIISTLDKDEVQFTVGIHNITLTVEDAAGLTATDEVVIEIQYQGDYSPVDNSATQETKNLLTNLATIGNGPDFIFGQEFPMSFKLDGIRWDMSTSDSKEVAGDHPGVFGIDPHYMLYKSDDQRDLHIEEARLAYQNGGVVTFDFHQQSRFDNKIYIKDITDDRDKSLMYDIVNDLNGSREWYFAELDVILGWINVDLGFPVVFRLFHEMNGGWFWWGTDATGHSSELYKEFFRLSADYLKANSNLVLFSWSPNHPFDLDYYPGNDYVDVVGVDIYEPGASQLTTLLKEVSAFAVENNKIAALTETGQRDDYINNHPEFWTSTILKAIKDGGDEIKVAWVLGWFNAPWASSQSDLFIPNAASPSNAKNDFIKFYNDDMTLFLRDTENRKMYE